MPSPGRKLTILAATVAVVVVGVATWLAWPHLKFFWLFEPLGKNEQGYPEYKHRQTGIVMVRVPGGTFWMGSPETEPERYPDEGPVHEVELLAFLIGKYEIRQGEWERIVERNPSYFAADAEGAEYIPPGVNLRDLPVESVSWNDIQEFCRETGLRLPTEAQWEYTCRASTTTSFTFGVTISTDQVNYDGNYDYKIGAFKGIDRGRTVAVTSFKPNAFGIHNMHGNVWEWCEDVEDMDFYGKPEARDSDPVCRSGSRDRIYRGGGWRYTALYCRSANRMGIHPSHCENALGFRVSFWPLP